MKNLKMKTTNITIKYQIKLTEKLKKFFKKTIFLDIFEEITTSLFIKPSIIFFVMKNISSSLFNCEIFLTYSELTNLLIDI